MKFSANDQSNRVELISEAVVAADSYSEHYNVGSESTLWSDFENI